MGESRTSAAPSGSQQLQIAISVEAPGYLSVSCPPTANLRWLLAAVDQVHGFTARWPGACVLADLSAVAQPPGMTEQLLVGEHAARQLRQVKKLASVVAEGTRSGLSEGIARRLGLNLRVFTSRAEAVDWLLAA